MRRYLGKVLMVYTLLGLVVTIISMITNHFIFHITGQLNGLVFGALIGSIYGVAFMVGERTARKELVKILRNLLGRKYEDIHINR